MKKAKIDNSSSKVVKAVGIGAGLAALAAAYFFLGPKGKKHQHDAKSWASKMKKDVIAKLRQARDVTEPAYNEIVDTVAKKYEKGKKAGKDEVRLLAQDLKKHWKIISKAV